MIILSHDQLLYFNNTLIILVCQLNVLINTVFIFIYKITGIVKDKSKKFQTKIYENTRPTGQSPNSKPRAHPHHKSQNNSSQQKESETSLKQLFVVY